MPPGRAQLASNANQREVVRLQRWLGPAEAERRAQIKAAARALASEGGYEATTIRRTAQRARVAPATVYRYYASKDHLLYEVMFDWAGETVRALSAMTFTGTPAERVSQAFQAIVRMAVENLNLVTAGVISFNSPDTAAYGMTRWHELFVAFVRPPLADDAPADLEQRALVLGHVLTSCFVAVTSGRTDTDEACALIDSASHFIFD